MSKSPEHDLQKQIVGYLRSNGILTIGTDVMSGLMFFGKNQTGRMCFINHHKRMGYTVGQPDLVLLLNDGETLLVELKDGNNKPSLSKRFLRCCLKSGVTTMWCGGSIRMLLIL